ncbi:MAG: hypothetical protein HY301_04840 [Verrucomicrobia bacterium]|nr:hypothetical protein [Verrucomicrobiota bacterium]
MSALKFLCASPSFLPMWRDNRRYRAARQGMLPDFGTRAPWMQPSPPAPAPEARLDKCAPTATTTAETRISFASPLTRGHTPAPAQPELALENIRVVRNDLCNSDWEWQAAEDEAGYGENGLAQKAVNLWRRIATRWGGARAQDAG